MNEDDEEEGASKGRLIYSFYFTLLAFCSVSFELDGSWKARDTKVVELLKIHRGRQFPSLSRQRICCCCWVLFWGWCHFVSYECIYFSLSLVKIWNEKGKAGTGAKDGTDLLWIYAKVLCAMFGSSLVDSSLCIVIILISNT